MRRMNVAFRCSLLYANRLCNHIKIIKYGTNYLVPFSYNFNPNCHFFGSKPFIGTGIRIHCQGANSTSTADKFRKRGVNV